MDYNNFKEELIKELKNCFKEPVEIKIGEMKKVNTIGESLIFHFEDFPGVAPTLSLNYIYKKHCDGNSIEVIAKSIAENIVDAKKNLPFIKPNEILFCKENILKNVFLQLVNTEINKELLETAPHRSMMDLSIIYKWTVKHDSDGSQTSLITNSLLEKIRKDGDTVTEEELYQHAVENSKKSMPHVVMPVMKKIEESLLKQIAETEDESLLQSLEEQLFFTRISKEMEQSHPMYIITNKQGLFGASAILYSDCLKQLSEKLEADLYILPSSLHELIAIPVIKEADIKELQNMVYMVNKTQVMPEDILSYSVYRYKRKEDCIEIVP